MRTLVDGSCLIDAKPTGVTVAVRALLHAGRLPIEEDATIVSYSSAVSASDALAIAGTIKYTHHRIPSRLVHLLCASGITSIDRLFGPADRLFLPNLNIVGIPRIPYDLLVHDLSFLIHPWWFTRKQRLWHRLTHPKKLIQRADKLFVLSEWTKQDLIHFLQIPPEKIHKLELPVTPPSITSEQRPIDAPYFLVFSAQDKRKNVSCVEIAFTEFVKSHPEWKLILVGMDGASIHPSIIHKPYFNDNDRTAWLKHATALLYPSWYEGLGLPPHEAASLGVPVFASGHGSITQTVPTTTTLLPPHRPEAWLQALISIAN